MTEKLLNLIFLVMFGLEKSLQGLVHDLRRKSSSVLSLEPTPKMENFGANFCSENKWYRAGINLRWLKSPVPAKNDKHKRFRLLGPRNFQAARVP
jgi:hypothetical protein